MVLQKSLYSYLKRLEACEKVLTKLNYYFIWVASCAAHNFFVEVMELKDKM